MVQRAEGMNHVARQQRAHENGGREGRQTGEARNVYANVTLSRVGSAHAVAPAATQSREYMPARVATHVCGRHARCALKAETRRWGGRGKANASNVIRHGTPRENNITPPPLSSTMSLRCSRERYMPNVKNANRMSAAAPVAETRVI